jgi:hypothetical protein
MANVTFNAFVEKAGDFLKAVAIVLGTFVLILLLVCIVFPFLWGIIFNPVIFVFFALGIPASAANWIYGQEEENDGRYNNPLDQVGSEMINWFIRFNRRMLGWEIRLLPWYARKHFVAADSLEFEPYEAMRYFRGLKSDKEKMQFLLPLIPVKESGRHTAFLNSMWNLAEGAECKMVLEAKDCRQKSFSVEEVKYACDHNLVEIVKENIENNTPSSEVLMFLMQRYTTTSDKNCGMWLSFLIKREGLASSLIDYAYSLESDKLNKLVEEGMSVYGQVSLAKHAKSYDLDEWSDLCTTTSDICPEAQKLMTEDMLRIFYKTNHNMSEEAIYFFLSKKKFVQEIFSHEPNFGIASKRIESIVKGSMDLLKVYNLAVKCKKA